MEVRFVEAAHGMRLLPLHVAFRAALVLVAGGLVIGPAIARPARSRGRGPGRRPPPSTPAPPTQLTEMRSAGPPVRSLDRYYFKIDNANLVLAGRYSVGTVEGTGADAQIASYGLRDPGEHVDGPEAWLYPYVP